MNLQRVWRSILFLAIVCYLPASFAQETDDGRQQESVAIKQLEYTVQPGDILEINVWKEEGLLKEVLVRPDGGISFPLIGDMTAEGLSLAEIQQEVTERLSQFIADPVVSISATQLLGNKIYVIGQVNKPGEYVVSRYVDVMQALSMAGGTTAFASKNSIIILRRDEQGEQHSIEFEYGDVEDGDDLEQNILLESGDVVVVP